MRSLFLLVAALLMPFLQAEAKTCLWTNGGGDYLWSNANNWSGGVPGASDVARFEETGLAVNAEVLISSPVTVSRLEIETSFVFSFKAADGASNASLSVAGVTSVGSGKKANVHVSVNVPVVLHTEAAEIPAEGTNCVWNITGWPGIKLLQNQSNAATNIWLYKTGSGELNLAYTDPTLKDAAIVREGTLRASAQRSVYGKVIVGGGEESAKLATVKYGFKYGIPYVYANGYAELMADNTTTTPQEFHVFEGGKINEYGVNGSRVYMQGGEFIGGLMWKGSSTQCIKTTASDEMAINLVPVQVNLSYNYTLNVEDGSPAVDLFLGGDHNNGGTFQGTGTLKTKYYLKKDLPGTVMSVRDMPLLTYSTYVWAGRWIVDNPGSCGLGTYTNFVQNGAILAGVGHLGGAPDADLRVSGKSTAVSVVAPGSVDTNTEAHVYGSLTVGTAEQSNLVLLDRYTRLEVGLGPRGAFDALKVFGPVRVAAKDTELKVVVSDVTKLKGGDYVILSATEGISGPFATVSCVDTSGEPVRGIRISYAADMKSVTATIPPRPLFLLVR